VAPGQVLARVAPDPPDQRRQAAASAIEHERRGGERGAYPGRVPIAEQEGIPRVRRADRRAPLPLVAEDAVAQRGTRRAEREAREALPDGVLDRMVVAGGEERRR